jgi:hypothetical protein
MCIILKLQVISSHCSQLPWPCPYLQSMDSSDYPDTCLNFYRCCRQTDRTDNPKGVYHLQCCGARKKISASLRIRCLIAIFPLVTDILSIAYNRSGKYHGVLRQLPLFSAKRLRQTRGLFGDSIYDSLSIKKFNTLSQNNEQIVS